MYKRQVNILSLQKSGAAARNALHGLARYNIMHHDIQNKAERGLVIYVNSDFVYL